MRVFDVLFVHDMHDQGVVIGPVQGDKIARTYDKEPYLYRACTTDFWGFVARNGVPDE